MTFPGRGPNALTMATAGGLDGPSQMRTGTVVEVTSRGVTVAVAEGLVPAAHLDSYAPAVGDPVVMASFRDSWLVLGRPVGTGTATDLATPGGAAGTTLLGGTALSGTNTTIATSTGAIVAVPRYRCTYYHPPGHQVLIMCGVTWYCSVAADTLEVSLWDGPTGTQAIGIPLNQASNATFSHFETFGAMLQPETFGGRKIDLYMNLQRIGGTGTSRVDDAAGRRGYMVALDMGDSSLVSTV